MIVSESKALKKGARVYWQGDAADSGTITGTSWDAVTIVWANGKVASVHHGECAKFRQRRLTDVEGGRRRATAPPCHARILLSRIAVIGSIVRRRCRTLIERGRMKPLYAAWQFWALLSAGFAALTAIFAKVGIEQVNSDFATFIRTIVILCVLAAILTGTGQWQTPSSVSLRSYVFLTLSGLATGASWLSYFRALKIGDAARVAPIDKLSVVLVALFGVVFLGERLSGLNWLGVACIAAGAILVAYRF